MSSQNFFILFPLNAGYQDDLDERDELGEDEPVLDPLDVGGLGQLLHHADQQGGQGQHHAQVHRDRRVEEVWQLEEGGGVADQDEKEGGKEGHEGLLSESPLEDDLQHHLALLTQDEGRGLGFVSDEVLGQLL